MTNKLNDLFDYLLNIMAYLGKSILVIIALLIIFDVLSSNLLNHSIPWVLEVTEYLLVFLTLLGSAWLLREDGHIKFDLVINHLPAPVQRIFLLVNSLVGFVISLIITISGFFVTIEMFNEGIHTNTILVIPRYLLVGIIPIGFSLLTIQFFRKFLFSLPKNISSRRKA